MTPTVTVNFGAALRRDQRHHARRTSSARASTSCGSPIDVLTAARRLCALLHAAAARPGQQRRDRRACRHDGAPREALTNDPVQGRALALFRRRPDAEAARRSDLRLRRLLQVRRQPARRGPVRRADHPRPRSTTPRPQVKGIELSANYDNGPWSLFGNLAWSRGQGHQHQLGAVQLRSGRARLHRQQLDLSSTTTRAGPARPAPPTSSTRTATGRRGSRPTCVYGNGLRKTVVTPNDTAAADLRHGQPVARPEDPDQGHARHAGPLRRAEPVRRQLPAARRHRASASAPRSSACAAPSWSSLTQKF